jgi:LPS O-antigen subunit length determinant protein (WzzB/FepE family)
MPRQLKNADVDFVSYVDKPANKRKFLMIKSKEELQMDIKQLQKLLEDAIKPLEQRLARVEKAHGLNQSQSIVKSQKQSNEGGVFDDLFEPRKVSIEKFNQETQIYHSLEERLGLPEIAETEEDEDFVAGRDFTDVHGERTSQKINGKYSFLDWDPNKEEDENAPKNYY